MNELEIIEEIKQDKSEYFKELVDKYKNMVFRICFGFVKNKEDAEDIAQDVFFTIYKNIKNFKFESKISTWIYRIAVNRSLNHIRKRKLPRIFSKINLKEGNVDEYAEIPASEDSSADFKVITDEKKRIIYKVLNGLPSNQRIAFTLYNIKGLTYEEIAEIMGCSISAVESRMHRAKMNLQKRLVKY
ncbi:MAG: sigma-70 family RNA polymerase sigma factor, partial [Candidatus Helarchaeota archaeon]|nr:sigma-70 family RNA polymerase sigma factor [Candidatus Helarchaeota archaeon]